MDMAIEILLSRGLITIIDAADGDLVEFKWYALSNGRGNDYAVRNRRQSEAGARILRMARVIAQRKIGRTLSPGDLVDHANRDSLDNRRANLRICNGSQNAVNRKKHSHRRGQPLSSSYRGVYWHKAYQKWVASIRKGDARYSLGYFDNEHAAAKAYDQKAIELFGNYANPNFRGVFCLRRKQ